MFLMAAATAGSLPTWYLANRVHAHTRLRIKDYCHNGTTWLELCASCTMVKRTVAGAPPDKLLFDPAA